MSTLLRASVIVIIWLDFYRNVINTSIKNRFSKSTTLSIKSFGFKIFAIYNFMTLFAFLKAYNYIHKYKDVTSFYYQIILWLTVVAFCSSILLNAKHSRRYINALIYSAWAYISAVFILYILGVQPSNKLYLNLYGEVGKGLGDASLLNAFGLSIGRTLLPFTPSIGTFAVLSGISLLSILLSYKTVVNSSTHKSGIGKYLGKNIRFIIWIFVLIASIFNILICDSRTSFYGVILTLALGYILINKIPSKIPIIISSVFVLSPFIGLFSDIILGFGTLIATRSNGTVLSSRDLVWLSALKQLSNFSLEHLFGYGLYGQAISGVSETYAWLFDGRNANSLLASLHNFSLQLIFDVGYFGLLTFSALVYFVLKKLVLLKNTNHKFSSDIFIYLIIYFSIIGITDSSPSIYTLSNMLVFYLIISIALSLPSSNTKYESDENGSETKKYFNI